MQASNRKKNVDELEQIPWAVEETGQWAVIVLGWMSQRGIDVRVFVGHTLTTALFNKELMGAPLTLRSMTPGLY